MMNPADITTRFEDAWNTHDMAAFGRLFHPDATFVNRFATYWRGVDQRTDQVAVQPPSIRRQAPVTPR